MSRLFCHFMRLFSLIQVQSILDCAIPRPLTPAPCRTGSAIKGWLLLSIKTPSIFTLTVYIYPRGPSASNSANLIVSHRLVSLSFLP